ncbi:hypothetical protein [Photobacterium kasasachensis]|uniref:hypothetical protein n=1 Tax=Photobacterium kasasachensis TaxID=2910240 RepID=UPI003D0ACC62
MHTPKVLNLEHTLTVPGGIELTLVMHEYGLYVSKSQLVTNWYDFRLLALVIVFSQQGQARRLVYPLPKQSDLFDLQLSFQLCVHQTCSGRFQPSRIKISYSFVDVDDARETIYEFWKQLLKHVKCLENLKKVEI